MQPAVKKADSGSLDSGGSTTPAVLDSSSASPSPPASTNRSISKRDNENGFDMESDDAFDP